MLFKNRISVGIVFNANYNSNCLFLGFYTLVDIGCGGATNFDYAVCKVRMYKKVVKSNR
jgi:hypothetical protein